MDGVLVVESINTIIKTMKDFIRWNVKNRDFECRGDFCR